MFEASILSTLVLAKVAVDSIVAASTGSPVFALSEGSSTTEIVKLSAKLLPPASVTVIAIE